MTCKQAIDAHRQFFPCSSKCGILAKSPNIQLNHAHACEAPAAHVILQTTHREQLVYRVMKMEELRPVTNGNVPVRAIIFKPKNSTYFRVGHARDFHGAKQAVEVLLLRFVDGGSALVQDREGRLVKNETYEGHALLLAHAEQVVPVVHSIESVHERSVTRMQ